MAISANKYNNAVDTLKFLCVDAINQANSGHPGLPMGVAYYAFCLWYERLRFNPADPTWAGRDRFVLSAGHGSTLLYSLLHLFEYDLSLDEVKKFRQLDSATPGHPEYGHTVGVEVTTGPLGQGFANGVGMAIAARNVAARVKDPALTELLSPLVYAICGDGDMMEGITSEAASLAGHLQLGNLIYFYDDNHITIEGDTDCAFTEDVGARFSAYGWQVLHVDPYDRESILAAHDKARAETQKPSLLIGRTTIGAGAPNMAGSAAVHGSPLGEKETAAAKTAAGFTSDQPFYISAEVRQTLAARVVELKAEHSKWQKNYQAALERNSESAQLLEQLTTQAVPADLKARLLAATPEKPTATRASSGKVLQAAAAAMPALMGGSADLAPSTKSWIDGEDAFLPATPAGRNLHFGVREHAMAAIVNGMALYGYHLPYDSTFLTFSDYSKPALRLAALMSLRRVSIFTHDSIGVGEDGPTHQPIEHYLMLRSIPGMVFIRPADAFEVASAWEYILRDATGPVCLALTRQNLPPLPAECRDRIDVSRGAYLVSSCCKPPDLTVIATGSEVSLALSAAKELRAGGLCIQVVSMPSWELFEAQSPEYQDQILAPSVERRVAIESGVSIGWDRYIGRQGLCIAMDQFGASAPHADLTQRFGFTTEQVVSRIKKHFAL